MTIYSVHISDGDTISIQRNSHVFISFNVDCLAVPNNLLTHTHTHTHSNLAFKELLFFFSYTCGVRIVTSVNKGLLHVPFVHVFVLFYEKVKKQNKDVLAYFFEQTNKHIISMTFSLCLFALITLIGVTREAPPFC